MSNPVRILIVILSALALWYLVIRLARSMDAEEVGVLPGAGSARIAAAIPSSSPGPGPDGWLMPLIKYNWTQIQNTKARDRWSLEGAPERLARR